MPPVTDTISSVITTALNGFVDQAWLVAPLGLAAGVVLFGVPRLFRWVKGLAS